MNRALARAIAGPLVLIVSFATAPLSAQQTTNSAPQTQTGGPNTPAPRTQAPTQGAPPDQSNPANHQPQVELPENPGRSSTAEPNAAPAQEQQPQRRSEPNGTAVAPQIATSGGAASKPAGVALAPPKQRRIRSLLIKLGVLAGAGIAIGTVAGLSAASPSRVPNSPGH